MKFKVIGSAVLMVALGGAGIIYYRFLPKPSPPPQVEGINQERVEKKSQPSEKALKLVSYVWVRTDEEKQEELRNEYKKVYNIPEGVEVKDSDVIRAWAFRIDNPTDLAHWEALVQKTMAEEGQSVTNNTFY
ncbi:hypothetical protein A3A66_01820 [Microgenomates group bacterium RIFCSPLOWO2_01_FULL_46_13]|nr:MAG: hypothetical protein A3A66_01820 [Microgenomates group bacterium RIFCSPLOWO2_01_FULL_46_13]